MSMSTEIETTDLPEMNKLIEEYKWQLTPRLISAYEVADNGYGYYDPDFGGIAKALPDGYWTSTPHGWINKDDGRKGVWAIIGHSSALRYDDAYIHFYGIRPVVTVNKSIF